MKQVVLAFMLCVIPLGVDAKVVISEFMYDAPGTDDNQEWIELHNEGGNPIDLSKWKINDGSNHVLNIPPKNGGSGSITIPGGGYVILSDDASSFISGHAGIAVSVIDTTLSLSNTGATIQLLNETGVPEDSVTYAKSLGGAGTGDTIHWNGSAYVFGAPTPGGVFAGGSVAPPPETAQTTSVSQTTNATQSTASTPPVSSYVAPLTPSIFAYAGKDRDVIAGAETVFVGSAYDKNGDEIDNADKVRFVWTFGDGGTAEGARVMHRYAQPGRYAVVLDIAQVLSSASAQVVVTAHPVSIGVSVNNGSMVLTNNAGRDLDISGWHLRAGSGTFTLPPRTVLLAGASVPFAPDITRISASTDASLLYPNGVVATQTGEVPLVESIETPTQIRAMPTQKISSEIATVTEETEHLVTQSTVPQEVVVPFEATSSVLVATAAESVEGVSGWMTGVGMVTLLGAVGVALARRVKKQEWDIEEIT